VELEGVRSYKQQAKQHSNLVPIEHVGETDTCYYYVMPLADDVKGAAALRSPDHYEPKTLQWCLDNLPPMSPEQVHELAQQLLDAITDLHDVGLMHADVKPANVMQLADRWKLGDLGLMTRSEQQSLGRGTVAFWPPEGPTGPTADLYALGKTLYLAITHQSLQSFDAFVAGNLPVLGNPTVINHLRNIIHRACHPEPDQRIQTAREFGELLNATPEPVTPDPVTPGPSPVPAPGKDRTTSRWKKPATLAAGCLLGLLLIYAITQSRPTQVPGDTVNGIQLSSRPLENLHVEHLPAADNNNDTPLGTIGVSSFWVKPAEQIEIQVRLEKPARFFVIQLKSPGDMYLAYPSSDTEDTVVPPAQSSLELQLHINEPPADPRTPYCLGVMLVILNEPLTFSEWVTTLDQTGSPNWQPVQSKHCWFYQGGQSLFEARSRGIGPAEKAIAQPPEELARFCQAVQENKGTAQVQLVTFPVLSTHVGSRGL
jgi:serine/threonine protein kinase